MMNFRVNHLKKFHKKSVKRTVSCALSVVVLAGTLPFQVLADESENEESVSEESEDEEEIEEIEESKNEEEEDSGEEETSVLLAEAGFSYAFAAKKVSLRDVEDRMYTEGVITAMRTEEEDGLMLSVSAAETDDAQEESEEEEILEEELLEEELLEEESEEEDKEEDLEEQDTSEEDGEEDHSEESSADEQEDEKEDNRVIEETTLTPVQQKEQDVVEAVSETQNIEVDTATATILSATAVSVVSDTDTAVALAEMADKKQTQAKLDQGVISAVEAETLMAASENTSDDNEEVQNEETLEESGETEESEETEEETEEELEEEVVEEESEEDPSAENNTVEIATDADGNEIVVAKVTDYINIRAEADAESDIVGKLYNGSVAVVLGRTGNGWIRIQSGDVTGYIREEYVATGEEAEDLAESVATKQAVVTTETLRVRAAPLIDSDVISLIAGGETLDIIEVLDGWYKVSTPDGEGYISADFADIEEVYPEAVSIEEEEAEEEVESEDEEDEDEDETTSSSSSSSSSTSTSALNTYTGGSGSGSSSGSAVANYALQFVGNPYVWGGSSLTNGTDCSGFTMAVYANFGVSLPHSSSAQASCGTAVASLDEAQPGDLLIYSGHVAIYLGNNQIVHASNPTYGITTGTATYRTILAIRRIFN